MVSFRSVPSRSTITLYQSRFSPMGPIIHWVSQHRSTVRGRACVLIRLLNFSGFSPLEAFCFGVVSFALILLYCHFWGFVVSKRRTNDKNVDNSQKYVDKSELDNPRESTYYTHESIYVRKTMTKAVVFQGKHSKDYISHNGVVTMTLGIGDKLKDGNYSLVVQCDAGSDAEALKKLPIVLDELRNVLLMPEIRGTK